MHAASPCGAEQAGGEGDERATKDTGGPSCSIPHARAIAGGPAIATVNAARPHSARAAARAFARRGAAYRWRPVCLAVASAQSERHALQPQRQPPCGVASQRRVTAALLRLFL